jgi:hypothetical protein
VAGKYKIEIRDLSRDSVNQLNKNFDKIEKDIAAKGGAAPAPALTLVRSPSGPVNLGGPIPSTVEDVTNINKGGGSGTPGPVGPPGPPSPVFTDGVTIGGNGNGTPIFLIEPLAYSVRSTSTTPDAVTATDVFIFASATAGADIIENLPAATGSGRILIFKKMDANAHNVVITPNGTDTIDGVNNATLSTLTIQYDALRLVDAASGAWAIW